MGYLTLRDRFGKDNGVMLEHCAERLISPDSIINPSTDHRALARHRFTLYCLA